jgi:hypothetical protein
LIQTPISLLLKKTSMTSAGLNTPGSSRNWRGGLVAAGVIGLLIILGLQLVLSVRRESQPGMKATTSLPGYRSWTHADFGLNPEHPPMLKLLATVSLFSAPLKTPKLEDRYFKEDAFLGGKDFLYQNDADKILLRTRLAAEHSHLLLGCRYQKPRFGRQNG